MTRFSGPKFATALQPRGVAKYAVELLIVGAAYFAPGEASASTLACDLLDRRPDLAACRSCLGRRPRARPARLAGDLRGGIRRRPPTEIRRCRTLRIAVLPAGDRGRATRSRRSSAATLINVWSQGRRTFDTPTGIAKFAWSPRARTHDRRAVGVGSLYLAGYVDAANLAALGGHVVAARRGRRVGHRAGRRALGDRPSFRAFNLDSVLASGIASSRRSSSGLVAFSPLIEQSANRSALALPRGRCRCSGRRCAAASATPRPPRSFSRALRSGAPWRAADPSPGATLRSMRSCC